MDSTKKWYHSRTVLASLVTVATATGGLFGMPVSGIENAAVTDGIIQAITAISGLVALFGRLSATTKIV